VPVGAVGAGPRGLPVGDGGRFAQPGADPRSERSGVSAVPVTVAGPDLVHLNRAEHASQRVDAEPGRRGPGFDRDGQDGRERLDGVVDHEGNTEADDGRDERDEDLKGHTHTQPKATDVDLTGLALQIVQACRVFVFEVPALGVKELRLLLQECRRIPGDLRIAGRQPGGDRGREPISACQSFRCFDFRLVIITAQDPTEHAFGHVELPAAASGMVAYALRIGNILELAHSE